MSMKTGTIVAAVHGVGIVKITNGGGWIAGGEFIGSYRTPASRTRTPDHDVRVFVLINESVVIHHHCLISDVLISRTNKNIHVEESDAFVNHCRSVAVNLLVG